LTAHTQIAYYVIVARTQSGVSESIARLDSHQSMQRMCNTTVVVKREVEALDLYTSLHSPRHYSRERWGPQKFIRIYSPPLYLQIYIYRSARTMNMPNEVSTSRSRSHVITYRPSHKAGLVHGSPSSHGNTLDPMFGQVHFASSE
jgi:hypothetical protein